MEECLASDYRRGGFYGRPVNSIPRDDSSLFPTSNVIASHPVIMTSTITRKGRSKRKHEHIESSQPSYVESCLVQLCRGKRWIDVVNRCRCFPEEACLVPIRHDVTRSDNTFRPHSTKQVSIHESGDGETLPLFRETALGVICSSKYISTDEGKQAILALLHGNPNQVGASQCIPGHTPLREAILNGFCTVEIFRILLEATFASRFARLSFNQKDKNGHTPMDHLVTSVQLGSSPDSVSMLREFVRIKKLVKTASSLKGHKSPLIQLLTAGNAFPLSASPKIVRKFSREHQPKESDNDTLRLQRVLHATRILLDDNPALLYRGSNVTKCTPLHIALRNYGNFSPLIEELLDRDSDNKMVKARNCYGDLPIHVACSVGVPFDVLALVIEKTAFLATISNSVTVNTTQETFGNGHCPLVWSSNKSGYTPVDLEWICHIEAGHGLYTARNFHPSDTTALKQHCFKQDAYYRNLLKMSVDEVTGCHDSKYNAEKNKHDETRKEEAETVFGSLLDRISLLIHAASSSSNSKLIGNATSCVKVVNSCQLGTPYSARLPLPILELFLWLRPEEVMEKDPQGFLPIHHSLRYGTRAFGCDDSLTSGRSLSAIQDWKSFVFQLLDKSSEQCKVKSREGRLPLHYALDPSVACTSTTSPTLDATSATRKALQLSNHSIVEKLVDLYPGSVDQKDPVTGLYPFMMASLDKSMSLNTIFFILRRSPSRCLSVMKAQKN